MGIHNWAIRMLGTVVVFVLLYLSPAVLGHGNMVWPMPWWDVHEAGAYWDQNGHDTHVGCGVLDLPHTEFEDHSGRKPDCMNFWFSNNVLIPGKATIPDEMDQSEIICDGQAGHHNHDRMKFPWHAPGTAPVFGPCGTLGAIPLGCNGGWMVCGGKPCWRILLQDLQDATWRDKSYYRRM